MRQSPKWMVLLDDRILEFIREEGARPPSKIAEDSRIRYSEQHIGNRCRKLAEQELLQNIGNGVYEITEKGEEYLDGTLDLTEIEDEPDVDESASA